MDELTTALSKAKINLMSRTDSAFFTTVCFSLIHEWDNTIPTAATNGIKLKINPDFFMSLQPEERIFILLHESLHVALLHTVRLGNRDHKKFNIAADHVINLMLIERGFKMPKIGVADKQYSGLSTEEVYNLLPDPPAGSSYDCDIEPSGATEEELQEAEQQITDIIVRASIQSKMQGDKPGTIPGDIQIYLDSLLNPKLPWHRILRRFLQATVKNDYSFVKPNRRFFPKHILPGLSGNGLVDIAVAVDASGSVSDEDFHVFVSELGGIIRQMKPETVNLITFDTGIRSVDKLESIKDLMKVKFTGRGGTCIGEVIEWANKNKPKVLLMFTDGGFDFYDYTTKQHVVWLIHGNKNFTAKYGKVIHYDI